MPLIEIVTEPDLRSAADAAEFFSRLREMLVWLGVNDGNMEEGSLRCDANVSVRPAGATALGTKAEVKNLNSFRFLQKALEYEIERQIDARSKAAAASCRKRGSGMRPRRTVSMRSKEEAHDYRYFPEPDLPPLVVDAERLRAARGGDAGAARRAAAPVRRARTRCPSTTPCQLTQSRGARRLLRGGRRRRRARRRPRATGCMGELARTLKEAGRRHRRVAA